MNEIERACSALHCLNSGCSREEWIRIGMAAKSAGIEFDEFQSWSQNAGNYAGEKDCKNAWKSFDKSGGITAATLFSLARAQGWQDPEKKHTNLRNSSRINRKKETSSQKFYNENAKLYAFKIWERCLPVQATHGYIFQKNGKTDGLRYYPSTAPPLLINGKDVTDYLAVPCWKNDELQTIQFFPPKGGKKLNLPGTQLNDGYFVVGTITDNIYICEGLGQAWAVNEVSKQCAVVCFGAGRMMTVAKVLRAKYPAAHLMVVPDRGKEEQAAEIATAINGEWVAMPSQFSSNDDVNDYLLEHGENALRELLANPVVEMPLSVVFADELADDFTPPDELVEGVLTAGDGSILYGDSNSGKTFFVIDLACAIARGVEWIGRKTEAGLIIYLAAESPASVKRRLQAYQKHHNVRITNFAIVQSPINLFDNDADTNAIIKLVRLLEKKRGQKVRLIIGDTLARLSAGANESAGQDMSLVIRHFDCIRNECDAHFMLIHHSGKNAAAGARGWSGVRAAVDTEIEVTDSPAGRCAEITKQRDLDTKGVRIGFRLETVSLGLTKWKSPATSCVVAPADAPPKNTNKRLSEVGGAIIEYLNACSNPIKKRELVRHFEGRYDSSAVYRELKKLVKTGQATDYMGSVNILVRTGAN